MSYRPMKCYKFDSLTPQQKFEIVANDPTIRVVASEFSVTETTTKPLSMNAVGLLLLGVASAIFHGDAADVQDQDNKNHGRQQERTTKNGGGWSYASANWG